MIAHYQASLFKSDALISSIYFEYSLFYCFLSFFTLSLRAVTSSESFVFKLKLNRDQATFEALN